MEPTAPAPPSEEDGADPFEPLKTIAILGLINLKVPAIWPFAWDETARMWCCCEDIEDPAADTGTLWIDVDIVELDRPVANTAARDEVLDAIAERIKHKKGAPKNQLEVTGIEFGKLIRYQREFQNDKGWFTEHRWHSLSLVASDIAVVHYSLILTAATENRPAWRRLVETMDREIHAAEFAGLTGV